MIVIVRNTVEALDLKAQVNQVCRPDEFTWRYTPRVDNWLGDETIIPATVEFEFTDAAWETYFQLKWS